jgi:AraC-like DNA-binding protein
MPTPESTSRPCYSLRLIRPFLRLLERHPAFPPELLAPLYALDPDERLPINAVHELLRGATELTGDPDLGLKAARELELGEFGAVEYVAQSARTVRDAIDVIGRYLHLVNDAIEFRLELQGKLAIVKLHNSVVMPRAAETFEVAAFQVAIRRRADADTLQGRTIHFTHERPSDVSEYEKTFDAEVLFSQPFTGFSFDAATLELPLPWRDPYLHEVLRRHADQAVASLPKVESFVERVRGLVLEDLPQNKASAKQIADRLHMSVRTLSRRLEEDGTSFRDLLNDVRKHLALRYASSTDLDLTEIAFLLGFSSSAVFHRSFKRWTGVTPRDYRQAHRG